MEITYQTRKDLPCDQLYHLFYAVGWSEKDISQNQLDNFNIGFLHSTLVYSAWDGAKLVGCIRVLSDQIFRSIIYDLAILPEYQGKEIGTELVKRCLETYPKSEWLVGTETASGFYQKLGFQMPDLEKGVILNIPSKWF